jgi:cell division protein FtsW (lipid II flippase)
MLKNIVAGTVLLVLSVGYYLAAARMPTSILDTSVNSAAFPKLLGIAGAVFSLALIMQGLLAYRSAPATAPGPDAHEASRSATWQPHLRALGLLAIVCLFVLALKILGYPVAVALLILAVSVYQGSPLSWVSIAVAVGGALCFWLFFMVFLGIHMPLGIWSRAAALLAPALPA